MSIYKILLKYGQLAQLEERLVRIFLDFWLKTRIQEAEGSTPTLSIQFFNKSLWGIHNLIIRFDDGSNIIFINQEIIFDTCLKNNLKKNGNIESFQLKSGSENCGISGWAKFTSISSCGRL